MTEFKKAMVVEGELTGRVGEATMPNELGYVMFYPVEGKHPYRICLGADKIKYLE